MGAFTKEAKAIIIHNLFNALRRSLAEIAIIIVEPITTKVKGDRASVLELEFMLIREGFDDGRRILTGNQQIINVHSHARVVISAVTHPDIAFGLGGNESHVPQHIRKPFMPT